MNTEKARFLYKKYASSVAYVEVEDSNGKLSIGSAFHIGKGIFITAKHVVENLKINKIGTMIHTDNLVISNEEHIITLVREPLLHPIRDVDVACLITDADHLPRIPLGTYTDVSLRNDMILHSALLFGYPPVPLSKIPVLICTITQINAIIDMSIRGHFHFIMSAMSRGGFSGGVCLHENEFALGVITKSLLPDSEKETELGYLAVLSVEPVNNCLEHYRISL